MDLQILHYAQVWNAGKFTLFIDCSCSVMVLCTILSLIKAPGLLNAPCFFSENNVILTFMNSCLHH